MAVLREKFKSDFKLRPTGSKGWNIGPVETSLYCPSCKTKNGSKLAFIFDNKTSNSSFHCVKCGFSCRLEKYLWLIKKREYISKYKQVKKEDILHKKDLIKEDKKLEIPNIEETCLPLLFKRLNYSSYLQKRGAKLDIYKKWIIGKTDFEEDLKGYIIFVIQENGINVGWVARSQYSKEYIEKYNEEHKKKILRWRNSKNDFGQIVFGLDEINKNTKELIIVEGITSKLKTDCELSLYKEDSIIKCCCTFGKKITDIQLQKIKNKSTNVEKVILFYDSDAILESKKTIYKFKELFKEVYIAFCTFKNEKGEYKDAGDLKKEEFDIILNNLQTPFQFFENNLNRKFQKLKKLNYINDYKD